jgi:hypothetical protein
MDCKKYLICNFPLVIPLIINDVLILSMKIPSIILLEKQLINNRPQSLIPKENPNLSLSSPHPPSHLLLSSNSKFHQFPH